MIFTTQINPTCRTYVLQSLQGHTDGIYFLIFLLKISRDLESFVSFCKMSHIFGAKKETISLSLLFVSLERYSLINCNCCFFPQKFHSLEVGKALVRICVFLLLEFSYFYGVLWQRFSSQASFGKMMTCHYVRFSMLFRVFDLFNC